MFEEQIELLLDQILQDSFDYFLQLTFWNKIIMGMLKRNNYWTIPVFYHLHRNQHRLFWILTFLIKLEQLNVKAANSSVSFLSWEQLINQTQTILNDLKIRFHNKLFKFVLKLISLSILFWFENYLHNLNISHMSSKMRNSNLLFLLISVLKLIYLRNTTQRKELWGVSHFFKANSSSIY